MMWTDSSPLNIKYIGVNTGFGSTGQWILYGEYILRIIIYHSIYACLTSEPTGRGTRSQTIDLCC